MTNKTTRIALAFGDGTYDFQLRMAGMIAVEEKCSIPIGAAYAQIMRGRFRDEKGEEFGFPAEAGFNAGLLLEVVRQALIGGNKGRSDGREFDVTPLKANALVDHYLNPDRGNAMLEAWNLAAAILHAAMVGVEITPDEEREAQVAVAPEIPNA